MLMPEKQVTGRTLSIALHRAGIRYPTQYYWVNDRLITLYQLHYATPSDRPYAAYGIAEIGRILPTTILGGQYRLRLIRSDIGWDGFYTPELSTDIELYKTSALHLPETAGKIMLSLAQDGIINVTGKAA